MQTTNQLTSNSQPSAKSEVVRALCELLNTGDEADRCYASRTLGVLGDPITIPELIKCLHDKDVDVCVDSAGALGRMKAVSAISELIECVKKDPDGEVKVAAVAALGIINHESAIDTLISIAASRPEDVSYTTDSWDPWWDMQLKAVNALGLMRVEKAAPVIEKLLDDEDGQDIESELLKSLAFMGESGEKILIKRLKMGASRERRRIVRALGHRLAHLTHSEAPETLRILKLGIREPNAEVRCAALEALMLYGSAEQLPEMIKCFHDEDPEVRKVAAQAVSKLSDKSANKSATEIPIIELIGLLDDNDPSVRTVVLDILSDNIHSGSSIQLDESQLEKVFAALVDKDTDVIAAACRLNGKCGNINARQQLLESIKNTALPTSIRRTATQALGNLKLWDETIATTLTYACVDKQQSVRLAALNALLELESISKNIPSEADNADQSKQYLPETNLSDVNLPDVNLPDAIGCILFVYQGKIIPEADAQAETKNTEKAENTTATDTTIDLTENAEADNIADGSSATAADLADMASSNNAVTSTIDAISRTNVQVALSAQNSAAGTVEDDLDTIDDEALKPYLELAKKNAEIGQWLKTRDTDANTLDDARRLATRILGKADDPQIITLLIQALDDKDVAVRRDAANSLTEIYARKPQMDNLSAAIKALNLLLGSSDRDERIVGLQSLGLMAEDVLDDDIINNIKTLMDDKDPAVCIQAIASLSRVVGCTPCNTAETTTIDDHDTLTSNHSTTVVETVEHFSQLLDNTDPGIRIAAATGLIPLINMLHSGDNQPLAVNTVKQIAYAGLSNNGDQARILGRVLKNTLPETATLTLLSKLTELETSRERRFVIEMLEEIFSSNEHSPVSS